MRVLCLLLLVVSTRGQVTRSVGRLQEVFAWKQITFNINGQEVLQDRFGEDGLELDVTRDREKRQSDNLFFDDNDRDEKNWDQNSLTSSSRRPRPHNSWNNRPTTTSTTTSRTRTTTTARPSDEARRFFIPYNNLPMGAERVGNRLFITLPRRRYGIPSTLNYLDLTEDIHSRSPGLRPYPDLRRGRALTSVYRTRADECGRLWMVDTGLLEIPNNRQQVQQPGVVAFDLNSDRQIFRYPLKSTDIVSPLTPTGLASITIDIVDGDCANAYAYIPDLATYGLIVYSLRDNDSWRLTHNYFSFSPTAGNLRIAGQQFQWNDGIFSVTLTEPGIGSCRTAYFHPMVGTTEFSVNTCVLRNRTASQDSNFWVQFSIVGDRGANSHSNMHGYHAGSGVVLFADIARDGVSCWKTGSPLTSANVQILAQDSSRLSYPSGSGVVLFADIVRDGLSCWKTGSPLTSANVQILVQDSSQLSYPSGSGVVLSSDIARDGVSCWKTRSPLTSANVQILAQDSSRLSYPSDLHITGDEVWVMANSLPTWAYSRLNTEQYNFFVYRADVQDLISGTVCAGRSTFGVGVRTSASDDEETTNTEQ